MISKIFILGLVLVASSCSVLPEGYEQLLLGTWKTSNQINTPAGIQEIHFEATFGNDRQYTLVTKFPTGHQMTVNFTYYVGYDYPNPAIIFYDKNGNITQRAIYFYFKNQNTELVTSINTGFELPRIWKR